MHMILNDQQSKRVYHYFNLTMRTALLPHLHPVTFFLPAGSPHMAMSLVRTWWKGSYIGQYECRKIQMGRKSYMATVGYKYVQSWREWPQCWTMPSFRAHWYCKGREPILHTCLLHASLLSSGASYSNPPSTGLPTQDLPSGSTSAHTPLAKWLLSISLLQTI